MKATVEIKSEFEVGSIVQTANKIWYIPKGLNEYNAINAKIIKIDFSTKRRSFYYLCEYDNGERTWLAEDMLKGAGESVHVNI